MAEANSISPGSSSIQFSESEQRPLNDEEEARKHRLTFTTRTFHRRRRNSPKKKSFTFSLPKLCYCLRQSRSGFTAMTTAWDSHLNWLKNFDWRSSAQPPLLLWCYRVELRHQGSATCCFSSHLHIFTGSCSADLKTRGRASTHLSTSCLDLSAAILLLHRVVASGHETTNLLL